MIAADRYQAEQVYRKHGRRYVAIEPFQGFPAPGVWLVTDRRQGICTGVDLKHLGYIPDPMDVARMELHRDAAVTAAFQWMHQHRADLLEKGHCSVSANQLVDLVFGAIAASMAERKERA